jgi:hypothetical protein
LSPLIHVHVQEEHAAACPLMRRKELPGMPIVTPPTPDRMPTSGV